MRVLPMRFALFASLVIFALQPALADGGPQHQTKQGFPIELGTSGGNIYDFSSLYCCSGTLGALVSKGGTQYILSNNHVLANTDNANVGDPISQPGLVDVGCDSSQANTVANFSAAPKLGTKNVDAAIAEVVSGRVSSAILDVGVPATTPVKLIDALNDPVAKSGRTTGLTCGTVSAVDLSVRVQYGDYCGARTGPVYAYTNQIAINGRKFSAGGDSGSLIVHSGTAQPVGLLFAGSSTTTIANGIEEVLTAVGATIVGGEQHTVACSTKGKRPRTAIAGLTRAAAAKERHVSSLMSDPAVMGVGVGVAEEDESEAVVVIYLEEGRMHGPIPVEVDGVRTRIIRTDTIRAFGWNETDRSACRR